MVRGPDGVLHLVVFRERDAYHEGVVGFLTEDCAVNGAITRNGKLYTRLRCLVVDTVYKLNNLIDLMRISDAVLHADFYVARIRNGGGVETYVFDYSSTALTEGLLTIGVTARRDVIDRLRTVLATKYVASFHFTVGFIYDPARGIYWEPGYAGVEVKKASREEVVNELGKIRKLLDEVKGAFRNPAVPLRIAGLYYSYALFQPYRSFMRNSDTPVPIVFGYPNINKTTLFNTLVETLGVGDRVTLITEGTHVTETLPRLLGLMTESTLPVVFDDVIMNDKVVNLILQMGAASDKSVSLARARQYGPGLRERMPIMRMAFIITNAEGEVDVYNEVIRAMGEGNRARAIAILDRRLVLINMNEARPNGAELRKILYSIEMPNMLLVLNHIVSNYGNELLMLMKQETEKTRDKYLNFLWFAASLWGFITREFGIDFSDVEDALYALASEREEAGRHRRLVIEEEIDKSIRERDVTRIRAAFEDWLEGLGIQIKTAADRLQALVRNADRARVVFKEPRWSDESIEIRRRVISLICENGEELGDVSEIDKQQCRRRSPIIDDVFIDIINELLRRNSVVVYLLYHAFPSARNRNGIGTPRQLLGRSKMEIGDEHGYRFTLDELLSILFDLHVDNEKSTEETRGNLNAPTPTTPTGGAYIGNLNPSSETGRSVLDEKRQNKYTPEQVGVEGVESVSLTPGSSEQGSDKIGVESGSRGTEGSKGKWREKVRWDEVKDQL